MTAAMMLERQSQPPEQPPRPDPSEPRRPRFRRPLPDGREPAPFLPWVALILLCCALFLPGLTVLPPFDRDEARFAQASRQMMESDDYVRIQYQGEPRNKKPVGIYWAQVAATQMFGGAKAPIAAHRIPSVLGATLAVLLLFGFARRLWDTPSAMFGAALLASSLLTVVEAHLAKTDAALLAATVLSQMALAMLYVERQRHGRAADAGIAALFWIGIGIGGLIKGPLVPLIALLTIISLSIADRSVRWLRDLRFWWGIPLALIIVAPWFIAISSVSGQSGSQGSGFIVDAFRQDLLPKLIGGQESHGAPPGLYLALLPLCFFPGIVGLVPALARGWRLRTQPLERFLLAWAIPAWVMFELVPTKLPHYVLPLYPALALLVARLVTFPNDRPDQLHRWWAKVPILPFALAMAVLAGIGIALPQVLDGRWDWLSAAALIIGVGIGGIAVPIAYIGQLGRAMLIAMAAAVALYATLLQSVLPSVDGFWLSRSAAEMITLRGERHPIVTVAGYAEPSLVFLLGTQTKLVSGGQAAEDLVTGRAGLALVSADQKPSFQAELAHANRSVQELGSRRGFNYSKGRWQVLTLYRLTP